jgi:SAM-dependent methyltransferase
MSRAPNDGREAAAEASQVEFFGELYLRSTRPFLDAKLTAAELDYLEQQLRGLALPGPMLDFGCGHGRHLGLGARLGRFVAGLDLDPGSLLEARAVGPVVRGDFFAPPFRGAAFAAAWAWYNSIFTFDDAQIRSLLQRLAALVKPGGLLMLQTVPRERLEAQPDSLFDGRLPDGTHLVEKAHFDKAQGRDLGHRTLTFEDGRVMAGSYFIRYYFLDELLALLEAVGFRAVFVHGGLDASPLTGDSADLIVGAQRG